MIPNKLNERFEMRISGFFSFDYVCRRFALVNRFYNVLVWHFPFIGSQDRCVVFVVLGSGANQNWRGDASIQSTPERRGWQCYRNHATQSRINGGCKEIPK